MWPISPREQQLSSPSLAYGSRRAKGGLSVKGEDAAGDRATEILLVEDNPDDIELTVEAFKEARIRNTINVVGDGVEALQFLSKEGKFRSAPSPDIILLDMHLPRLDGREFLEEIKNSNVLKNIPICILIASRSEQQALDMKGLGVACSLVKPLNPDDFARAIESLEESRKRSGGED